MCNARLEVCSRPVGSLEDTERSVRECGAWVDIGRDAGEVIKGLLVSPVVMFNTHHVAVVNAVGEHLCELGLVLVPGLQALWLGDKNV